MTMHVESGSLNVMEKTIKRKTNTKTVVVTSLAGYWFASGLGHWQLGCGKEVLFQILSFRVRICEVAERKECVFLCACVSKIKGCSAQSTSSYFAHRTSVRPPRSLYCSQPGVIPFCAICATETSLSRNACIATHSSASVCSVTTSSSSSILLSNAVRPVNVQFSGSKLLRKLDPRDRPPLPPDGYCCCCDCVGDGIGGSLPELLATDPRRLLDVRLMVSSIAFIGYRWVRLLCDELRTMTGSAAACSKSGGEIVPGVAGLGMPCEDRVAMELALLLRFESLRPCWGGLSAATLDNGIMGKKVSRDGTLGAFASELSQPTVFRRSSLTSLVPLP